MNEVYSSVITFSLSVATVLWFLYIGIKNKSRKESAADFFIFGHSLKRSGFFRSYAAASTSLGTVIFFFVILGFNHGVYILFSPITLLIGVFLFNKLFLPKVPEYFFDKNHPHFMGTLGEFIKERYKSRIVSLMVMAISLCGLLAILIIELFVGVSIFSIFDMEPLDSIALVLIAFVVWIYTSLGGMRSVVITDRIQLWVLILPVTILFLFLVFELGGYRAFSMENLFPNDPIFEGGFLLPWPMLANILVVNVLLTPSLLRTWQMTASTSSRSDVSGGMMRGAVLTVCLTALFVGLGLTFFKGVFVGTEPSLHNLLETLLTAPSPFLSMVLLPCFFVSCLAAIFSTVDSALLPIVHSLWVEVRTRKGVEPKRMPLEPATDAPLISAGILGFALLLYFVIFRLLGFDLISWMFTIFSFSIVIAPTVIFALRMNPEVLASSLGKMAAFGSLSTGFIVAVSLTLVGNRTGNIALVQLNSPLAALIGFVPFLALHMCKSRSAR